MKKVPSELETQKFDNFWSILHGLASGTIVGGLKVISRSSMVISRSFYTILHLTVGQTWVDKGPDLSHRIFVQVILLHPTYNKWAKVNKLLLLFLFEHV